MVLIHGFFGLGIRSSSLIATVIILIFCEGAAVCVTYYLVENAPTAAPSLTRGLIAADVYLVILFILTLFLFHGIYSEKRRYIFPWIVWQCCGIICAFGVAIYLTAVVHHNDGKALAIYGSCMLFAGFIIVYCLLCITSFFLILYHVKRKTLHGLISVEEGSVDVSVQRAAEIIDEETSEPQPFPTTSSRNVEQISRNVEQSQV